MTVKVDEVLQTAKDAVALLVQVQKNSDEQHEAYMELVRVAARMANRLGPDDPDYQALEALLVFQTADSIERVREMMKRKDKE